MERRGISRAIIMVALVLIILVAVAAYSTFTTSVPATTTMNGISPKRSTTPNPLVSFSADAYVAEAQALLSGFASSTGVPVAPVKSGGSFAVANLIAAGAPADVFISVSLAATGPIYLKNLSANWAVGFASDQMVLAYSNATISHTAAAGIVNQASQAARSNATSDWNEFFSSLTSGSVKLGIANPVADPAGLRGWLVLEAAGFLYGGGNQATYVAQLLQSNANVTGAHAAALVAPLQAGQIQFLLIYKSAAIGQHLGYLQLDRHVNLGDPTLATYYSQFSYTDSAGVSKGAPIILCVTVPLSSANAAEALQFVQYVVKNAGILSAYGLQPFSPAKLYNNTTPPQPVAQLVSQGLIVEAGSLH